MGRGVACSCMEVCKALSLSSPGCRASRQFAEPLNPETGCKDFGFVFRLALGQRVCGYRDSGGWQQQSPRRTASPQVHEEVNIAFGTIIAIIAIISISPITTMITIVVSIATATMITIIRIVMTSWNPST